MTLREIQLYKLGMMKDIASICDQHGLKYILHYGTLLGAIRHDGFIPWDDDVDLAMPWNDFKKLIQILNCDYSDRYFAQSIWTEERFPLLWMQIRANGTTSMPVDYASYDIHWGMCIDVFALVAAEIDEKKKRKREKIIHLVKLFLENDYREMTNQELKGRRLKLINRIPRGIRRLIIRTLLKAVASDPQENGFVSPLQNPKRIYAYADIMNTEKHVFEGLLFDIPKGFDNVLKTEYRDYMTLPPENQRGGHELALGRIINDANKDYKEYQAELKANT